jgi:hypothetical protein
MDNQLTFDILPFDPMVTPDGGIQLPLDLDDFICQLRAKFANGEINTNKSGEETHIRLYIATEQYGQLLVAQFTESPSYFFVSGWPKRMAKELILWYRHYVPISYPLFLIIPEPLFVAELTANTTLEDIEKMYPFPVPDD